MKLKELADRTGLAVNNLSILKTNKARAIRFSTLNVLCKVLDCTPGELMEYVAGDEEPAEVDASDPAIVGDE
jgi:putative transcriptional regulator